MTIKEILQYYGRIYGLSQDEIEKRMGYLMGFLDLPEATRIIGTLSGDFIFYTKILESFLNDFISLRRATKTNISCCLLGWDNIIYYDLESIWTSNPDAFLFINKQFISQNCSYLMVMPKHFYQGINFNDTFFNAVCRTYGGSWSPCQGESMTNFSPLFFLTLLY